MNIKTKFKLGDTVFPISLHTNSKWVECDTCQGTKQVTITTNDKTISCPDCWGKGGQYLGYDEKWRVGDSGIIGKVLIELYALEYGGESREVYMLDTTGVGTGIGWDADRIFATAKKAQAECDKRNDKL